MLLLSSVFHCTPDDVNISFWSGLEISKTHNALQYPLHQPYLEWHGHELTLWYCIVICFRTHFWIILREVFLSLSKDFTFLPYFVFFCDRWKVHHVLTNTVLMIEWDLLSLNFICQLKKNYNKKKKTVGTEMKYTKFILFYYNVSFEKKK